MNIKGEFSNWLYKRDIRFLMSEEDVNDLPDFDPSQDLDDPSSDPKKAKKAKEAEAEAKRRKDMSDKAQKEQQRAQSQPPPQSQSPQWHPPQPYSPPKPQSRLKPRSDALSQLEKYRDEITKKANSSDSQTPAQPASRQPIQSTQTNKGNARSSPTMAQAPSYQNPYQQSQPQPQPQSQSQSQSQRNDIGGKVRPASDYQDPWK